MKTQKLLLGILVAGLCHSCTMDEQDPIPEVNLREIKGMCCVNGKLHYVESFYGDSRFFSSRGDYFYDQKIRVSEVLKKVESNPFAGTYLTRMEYNEKDQMVKLNEYTLEGEHSIHTRATDYFYDDRGYIEKFISYYPLQGNTIESLPRVYDAKGNLIGVYPNTEDSGDRNIYHYDEEGKIKLRLWMLDDVIFEGYIYRYNERGLLIAEEFFKSNVIPEQGEGVAVEYDYDELDRIIEKREFDPYWSFVMTNILTYHYWDNS